jgi:hypothetical protein
MDTITIPSTATANSPILAIDLGKYKSVVCLFRSPDDVRFTSVPTTRAELLRLIEKHRPEVVLIEACLLCGWVRDLCVELGVACRVANTSSEVWKFKHLNARPTAMTPCVWSKFIASASSRRCRFPRRRCARSGG